MRALALFLGGFLLTLSLSSEAQAFACAGSDYSNAATICRYDSFGSAVPGMPNCATVLSALGDGSTNAAVGMGGARINSGRIGMTPIDKHGHCRFVDNPSGKDQLAPFRTEDEWVRFIQQYPRNLLSVAGCACPFSGIDMGANLYFGKSSVLKEAPWNDSGDDAYAPVSLPYWRAASTWPPTGASNTKTFNHSCYEEYIQPHCWRTCTRTVWEDYDCDSNNQNCKQREKEESYCCDEGSICGKRNHNWSEVFSFLGEALDSEVQSPSWRGLASTRIGGQTRPCECYTRCTFTGHDCVSCQNTAPAACAASAPAACVLPAPHIATVAWWGGVTGATQTNVLMLVAAISSAQARVAAAQAAGDCATAVAEQNALNDAVDAYNAINMQALTNYLTGQ